MGGEGFEPLSGWGGGALGPEKYGYVRLDRRTPYYSPSQIIRGRSLISTVGVLISGKVSIGNLWPLPLSEAGCGIYDPPTTKAWNLWPPSIRAGVETITSPLSVVRYWIPYAREVQAVHRFLMGKINIIITWIIHSWDLAPLDGMRNFLQRNEQCIYILEGFSITMATYLGLGLPHDFSVHMAQRCTLLPNFVKIGLVEAEIQRYLH